MYGGNSYGSIPYSGNGGSQIGTYSTDINSEVTGKVISNVDLNSEITGVYPFTDINSEIIGAELENTDINSEITGKQFVPIAQTYRILIKDENGNFIGEISGFKNLKFGKRLSNYGQASFDIQANSDKAAELVSLRQYSIWIYYQKDAVSTLVWSGEQAMREGNLDNAGNNWCTIYCYDWLEQLNSRYTASEKFFDGVDAGQIAWTLIDDTQDQTNGNLGITQGTIQTTVPRDRHYYNQNIMEAIVNLSNVLSGFDFEITNDKVFNVKNVIGTDKSNEIIIKYGHNVESVKIVEDFVHPTNRAIIIGQSTDDLNDLIRVERNNLTSQSEYKVRESLTSEMEVSETTTMEDKGDAVLRKYQYPLISVDINFSSLPEPNITQFGLGDALRFIVKSGIYNINEAYRVFEWTITFDSNNVGKLNLILGNFTYD
jgi:hypothetical protein